MPAQGPSARFFPPLALSEEVGLNRTTALLLNAAHTLDHLVLLIFASALTAIASDFGIARWEDLMPCTAGAFLMFGLGSIPAGRLGDLWGRRRMMLVFFAGIASSCVAVSFSGSPLQMAVALTVLGTFASIYHPVGIPMLLRHAARPGLTIGLNNVAGNCGIAIAALLTGFMVKVAGWRAAFLLPALIAVVLGVMFARYAPTEVEAPAGARRDSGHAPLPRALLMRALAVMTLAAISGSLLFNFTTNGNFELLRERFTPVSSDPALLGGLLALVYVLAATSQVVVGLCVERVAIKPLFFSLAVTQVGFLALAARTEGWTFYASLLGCMVSIFAVIPFGDLVLARYVEDGVRSRISGARIAIAFGVGALAVYLLGPIVKAAGFATLLNAMAVIAATTALTFLWLPHESVFAAARRAP